MATWGIPAGEENKTRVSDMNTAAVSLSAWSYKQPQEATVGYSEVSSTTSGSQTAPAIKQHGEQIPVLTQITGFPPDLLNLLHNFTTHHRHCVGINDQNQNMNCVIGTWVFVVERIVLWQLRCRIELENKITADERTVVKCIREYITDRIITHLNSHNF